MRLALGLGFGLDLLQHALLLDAELFERWIVVEEILRNHPRRIGGELACGLARRRRLAVGLRGAPLGNCRRAPFLGQILDARRVEPRLGFVSALAGADGFGQSVAARASVVCVLARSFARARIAALRSPASCCKAWGETSLWPDWTKRVTSARTASVLRNFVERSLKASRADGSMLW